MYSLFLINDDVRCSEQKKAIPYHKRPHTHTHTQSPTMNYRRMRHLIPSRFYGPGKKSQRHLKLLTTFWRCRNDRITIISVESKSRDLPSRNIGKHGKRHVPLQFLPTTMHYNIESFVRFYGSCI